MSSKDFLTGLKMPFCPGCGHGLSTTALSNALDKAGYQAKDVVVVSDIGCCGLVDPLLEVHTVHGLHGRSPALGIGVSLGLNNPAKKVIVIQGDGGATIGLQHVMEAARRNTNMCLIIENNQIYGMTGGQVSGLTSNEFKTERGIGDQTAPFNVCMLAHTAGAAYSARVNSPKNIADILYEAIHCDGFALVEISSLCPSYGAGKLDQLAHYSEEDVILRNDSVSERIIVRETDSLFNQMEVLDTKFLSGVKTSMGVVLAGSAGGGVQSAARLLAQAGIMCGLSASMKGEYPITIGTGFSVAEIIFSNKDIHYTGLPDPDVALVLTDDGLAKVRDKINNKTKVFIEQKLEWDHPGRMDGAYLSKGGKKGAVLFALVEWLKESDLIPLDALRQAASMHKHAEVLLATIDKADAA